MTNVKTTLRRWLRPSRQQQTELADSQLATAATPFVQKTIQQDGTSLANFCLDISLSFVCPSRGLASRTISSLHPIYSIYAASPKYSDMAPTMAINDLKKERKIRKRTIRTRPAGGPHPITATAAPGYACNSISASSRGVWPWLRPFSTWPTLHAVQFIAHGLALICPPGQWTSTPHVRILLGQYRIHLACRRAVADLTGCDSFGTSFRAGHVYSKRPQNVSADAVLFVSTTRVPRIRVPVSAVTTAAACTWQG